MRRETRRRLRRFWLYLVMIAACVGLAVLIAESDAADTRWYVAPAPAPAQILEVITDTGNAWTTNETTAQIANFDTSACAANCYLIVTLHIRANPGTPGSCTFGATPINQTVTEANQANSSVYMYGVQGVSGTANIDCSWPTARVGAITARLFQGVNQTTPVNQTDFTKSNTGTGRTVTLTGTVADSLIVDALYKHALGEFPTPGAGQTVAYNLTVNIFYYSASRQAGGGDITMEWSWVTSDNSTLIAWELNPA